MQKILLFVPVYNCEKQITRLLNKLEANVINIVSQVLIIDNLSLDGTPNAVVQHIKQSKNRSKYLLIQNSKNYNLGGSYKVALTYALDNGFTHLAICHGDDQADPNDLYLAYKPEIVECDCVMGARFLPDSKRKGYSIIKMLGNRGFTLLFSIVTRKRIKEIASGLYMLRLDKFQNRFFLKFRDDLTFDYFLTLYMAENKFNVVYFPISWQEEDQISNLKIFRQTWTMISILYAFCSNKKKFFDQSHGIDQFNYKVIDPDHLA